MARAQTITKLSLDRWAQLMGISPLHFNGIYVRAPAVCEQPWLQYAWQAADRVGREEVAFAIAQAEADIEAHLGYRLLSSWETDEWSEVPRPSPPELFNIYGTDIRGRGQVVRTKWGYFITGGVRAKTLIEAGAPIIFTDGDGDSYGETATVTVVTSVGNCEIRLYYPGHAGEDAWEIRPISVSSSGGTATITFRREQVVLANLQEDIVFPTDNSHLRGVDGLEDANFLDEVDVYRVYNDPQTQVTYLWEPFGVECTDCSGDGCEQCAYNSQTGCLMLRSRPENGMVSLRPASWDSVNEVFNSVEWSVQRSPDLARLYYYAGLRDKSLGCPTIRMNGEWERVVAYYAAALLERPLCECNNVRAFVERWQKDLAVTAAEESINLSPADLDSDFGTKRGALFAWRRVRRQGTAVGKAVLM